MAPLTFYYGSGSPFAWRVWYALEHKGIPYAMTTLSFDKGEHKRPDFLALNPRGRVPVIVDDGFALYESAAIVEYLEDRRPGEPRLFAADARQRAVQRRMMREADQYVAPALTQIATLLRPAEGERPAPEKLAAATAALQQELALWEAALAGDYLVGALSAADFTLYPQAALVQRFVARAKGAVPAGLLGPKLTAWARRMEALPVTRKTWPPHWK
ncbi:MAG TPA: glutathione S-transferase family protein [Stellaceae bacterium]